MIVTNTKKKKKKQKFYFVVMDTYCWPSSLFLLFIGQLFVCGVLDTAGFVQVLEKYYWLLVSNLKMLCPKIVKRLGQVDVTRCYYSTIFSFNKI